MQCQCLQRIEFDRFLWCIIRKVASWAAWRIDTVEWRPYCIYAIAYTICIAYNCAMQCQCLQRIEFEIFRCRNREDRYFGVRPVLSRCLNVCNPTKMTFSWYTNPDPSKNPDPQFFLMCGLPPIELLKQGG